MSKRTEMKERSNSKDRRDRKIKREMRRFGWDLESVGFDRFRAEKFPCKTEWFGSLENLYEAILRYEENKKYLSLDDLDRRGMTV